MTQNLKVLVRGSQVDEYTADQIEVDVTTQGLLTIDLLNQNTYTGTYRTSEQVVYAVGKWDKYTLLWVRG